MKTFASCKVFVYVLPYCFTFQVTFLILCEVQQRYSKTLKYSEQYNRDHLSGTKVRIWIYSEYDANFNFSCIAS